MADKYTDEQVEQVKEFARLTANAAWKQGHKLMSRDSLLSRHHGKQTGIAQEMFSAVPGISNQTPQNMPPSQITDAQVDELFAKGEKLLDYLRTYRGTEFSDQRDYETMVRMQRELRRDVPELIAGVRRVEEAEATKWREQNPSSGGAKAAIEDARANPPKRQL